MDDADLRKSMDKEPQEAEVLHRCGEMLRRKCREKTAPCVKEPDAARHSVMAKNDIETLQEKPKSNLGSLMILLVLVWLAVGSTLVVPQARPIPPGKTRTNTIFGEDEDGDENRLEIEIHSENGQEDKKHEQFAGDRRKAQRSRSTLP